jgi:hypothetical protein
VAAALFGNHVPLGISAQVYVTFSLIIKPLNNYLMFSRHSAACPAYLKTYTSKMENELWNIF